MRPVPSLLLKVLVAAEEAQGQGHAMVLPLTQLLWMALDSSHAELAAG